MQRNLLRSQLLVEIEVPHVPLIERGKGLNSLDVLTVLRLEQPLPPLGVGGEVETVGYVEAALEELFDALADCSQLLLSLLVLHSEKGD